LPAAVELIISPAPNYGGKGPSWMPLLAEPCRIRVTLAPSASVGDLWDLVISRYRQL